MELTEYKGFTIMHLGDSYAVFNSGVQYGPAMNSLEAAQWYVDSVLSVGI
jgi:hypothetical protein